MAIALVQSASGRGTSAGATVTATLGAAPTSGNLLVAVLGSNTSSGSLTPATGYAADITRQTGSATYVSIWRKVAGASEPAALAYTPASGSQFDLHLMEFSGLTVPTLDSSAYGDSGATLVATQATASTSPLLGTGDLLVVGTYVANASSAPTFTTGYTSVQTTQRMFTAWRTAASQAAQSCTTSWTTSGKAVSAITAVSPTVLDIFQGWGIPI